MGFNGDYLTVDYAKKMIKQMLRYLTAKAAKQLLPGAKINGVLFTGARDIEVPVSLTEDVLLTETQFIKILWDNNGPAGLVIRNDGIYFSDGNNLYSIVTITENNGSFTISSNVAIVENNETVTKTIGFIAED